MLYELAAYFSMFYSHTRIRSSVLISFSNPFASSTYPRMIRVKKYASKEGKMKDILSFLLNFRLFTSISCHFADSPVNFSPFNGGLCASFIDIIAHFFDI